MNFKLGKIQYGVASTATAAGTTTLVAGSKAIQIFTGTTTQIVQLPDATSTSNGSGIEFTIINASTGILTIKDNGSNTLTTVAASSSIDILLTSHATANGVWRISSFSGASGGGISNAAPLAKSANYTIVSGDNGKVIWADSTSGAFTLTLPAPTANFVISIKDISGLAVTNPITIARNGSELIDGAAANDVISTAYYAVSYISDGTNWFKISDAVVSSPIVSTRALFGGGETGSAQSVIDYIQVETLANSASFGNLNVADTVLASCGSATRGFWGGGTTGTITAAVTFVTFSILGNSVAFGNLTSARQEVQACSSSTRGVFGGGKTPTTVTTIDYITMAAGGNAVSFGALTVARADPSSYASQTRGLFCGGTGPLSSMDYITIATTGAASSFGTMFLARTFASGCSSNTRGLSNGGTTGSNTANTEYTTIATTGNGLSFGSLTSAKSFCASASSLVRATIAGGNNGSNVANIDYYTIATLASASNFGNITLARQDLSGCSNGHGGL